MWREQATALQQAIKDKHEDNLDLVATHRREAEILGDKHRVRVAQLENEVRGGLRALVLCGFPCVAPSGCTAIVCAWRSWRTRCGADCARLQLRFAFRCAVRMRTEPLHSAAADVCCCVHASMGHHRAGADWNRQPAAAGCFVPHASRPCPSSVSHYPCNATPPPI